MKSRTSTVVCALLLLLPSTRLAKAAPAPRIEVILWFDTEDFLLPADDDASKRLAEMLTSRRIQATFKIVGEKARTLERRGRQDVIQALKKHAIGYHSDFHSVHPTPTEYLAETGLVDGMAEFVRREGKGAADVRRIFGVKTLACYGQPGSSWAAQAVAALPQIGVAPSGVPCYVDEGNHVGLNNKPFWFAGALNVYHMGANYTRMELHDPAAVEPAKKKFAAMAERLGKQEQGGLISIFYHPCEWVHQEFWDGVNFARGANPPREEWKAEGQLSPGETDAAFGRFGDYIDFIRTTPGVTFITANDLPALYPDSVRTQGATAQELMKLSQLILDPNASLGFVALEKKVFSAADQFELLALAVAQRMEGKPIEFPLATTGLFGPESMPPRESKHQRVFGRAFRDAVLDVRDFILTQRRVPSRVFIGAETVAPAEFLTGLAAVYLHPYEGQNNANPESVPLLEKLMTSESYIARDTPKLFGDWVIHKQGFRAPKVLEIARLQAWTLKPALRKE